MFNKNKILIVVLLL